MIRHCLNWAYFKCMNNQDWPCGAGNFDVLSIFHLTYGHQGKDGTKIICYDIVTTSDSFLTKCQYLKILSTAVWMADPNTLFRNFLVGPIFILLSTGIGPWVGVSARVNANCNCPCRFFIWVDANCSYPWTPISLICWTIFIKTIKLHSYLSTDSVHILFLDWFCQNLCRIVHVCLFCSNFPRMLEKQEVSRFPSMRCIACSWKYDGL